jgi:hypothetical protein
MSDFYVTDQAGYLVSCGSAVDGAESDHAQEGRTVTLGAVPGFTDKATPYSGARWHVERQRWEDARSHVERSKHAAFAFTSDRRKGYPSIEDFADAYYWERQGDPSKMKAYIAKVAAVKARIPKPGVE